MRQLLTILCVLCCTSLCYSQKADYYIWKQVKTTDCSSFGIDPTLQLGTKKIKIFFAFTWNKSKCSEYTYNNSIKIPKLKKGLTITPDNKRYYYDGNIVYEVKNNSCSANTMTAIDFWSLMQSK